MRRNSYKRQSSIDDGNINRYFTRIYTDGSTYPHNPGKGAWAYHILFPDGKTHSDTKSFAYTTINRMELMAVIEPLLWLNKPLSNTIIYSDSQYVVVAINKGWLNKWIRNGFLSSSKREKYKRNNIKNPDLWKKLYSCIELYNNSVYGLTFEWVKSHSTNEFNNYVHNMAYNAASGAINSRDYYYEHIINAFYSN